MMRKEIKRKITIPEWAKDQPKYKKTSKPKLRFEGNLSFCNKCNSIVSVGHFDIKKIHQKLYDHIRSFEGKKLLNENPDTNYDLEFDIKEALKILTELVKHD